MNFILSYFWKWPLINIILRHPGHLRPSIKNEPIESLMISKRLCRERTPSNLTHFQYYTKKSCMYECLISKAWFFPYIHYERFARVTRTKSESPSFGVEDLDSRCPWNQKRLKLSVNANQYYSQQGWTFLIMSFQLVRLSSKQFALQKWWSYLNTIHVTVFQSATPNDMKLYRINMDRWVLKIIGSWLKVS